MSAGDEKRRVVVRSRGLDDTTSRPRDGVTSLAQSHCLYYRQWQGWNNGNGADRPLPLDPRHHDALDKLPLCEEKEQEDRQQHDQRDRHHIIPGQLVFAAEGAQPQRQGAQFRATEVDQRAQKFVPVMDETEDR